MRRRPDVGIATTVCVAIDERPLAPRRRPREVGVPAPVPPGTQSSVLLPLSSARGCE